MKKFLISCITILSFTLCHHAFAGPSAETPNLAGKYTCTGYDKQDKWLRQSLTIELDAKNSILQNAYGAYSFKAAAPPDLKVKDLPPNIVVTGSMAASGNTFAMSFKNTNPKASADYGTAIGVATYDQDQNGISRRTLHLFSYQPSYKGGDNSTWTCIMEQA